MIDLEKLKARARECQNLTDGLWLSKAADEIEYMRSVFAKSHEVAPAVDAQPVAAHEALTDDVLMQAIADTAARGHVWASRALSNFRAAVREAAKSPDDA
jgi:hypothetical protein